MLVRALALGWWLCLAAAAPARAQAPCGDAVDAWASEASRAIDVRIEPIACPPSMARLRLSPAGAPAIDVEVGEPPGPAFRHAGRLRTSPIVDVPDYGDLPAPQRAAYEALVAWLARNEARVRFDAAGPAPVRRVVTVTGPGIRDAGIWLVAIALLALAVARAIRPAGSAPAAGTRAGALSALALFAVALAGRLALGLFGPLHVNGQGPLWIGGALSDPSALASYGPGYAELFGPIARLGPPDTAIFVANAVLSALVPVFVYGIARAHALEPHRALLAALLVALDPVSVRIAATEAYFVPIAALTSAAAWIVSHRAAATRRVGDGPPDRTPAQRARDLARVALPPIAAALLCAQAARIHPVAWIPVALVPLFALPRARFAAVFAAILAAVLVLTSGGSLLAVYTHTVESGPGAGVLARAMSSGLGRRLAVAAVLAAGACFVARPRAPLAVAVAAVVADLVTRHTYGQSDLWQASYDRLFVAPVALGLASIAPRRLSIAAAAAVPALFAAAAVLAEPFLLHPTTEQREHAFLRDVLPRLDPECRVAYVERRDRRIVELPLYAAELPPIRIERPSDVRTPGCVYFVRSSICASDEARALCDAIPVSRTIASRTFPAAPSYRGLPYDRARVPVSIHTVDIEPP